MRSGNGQAGFTFNELLVAMGIVAVAVMSYSLSSIHLFRQQLVSDYSTGAINLAQEKMEELHGRRPLYDMDNCPDGGEQQLSTKIGVAGVFARCWRVAAAPLTTDLKRIDVFVSWNDPDRREIKLSTLLFTGE